MRLVVSPNEFVRDPYLTQAPNELAVLSASMDYFDKDGYEVNHTERVYYEHNQVNLREYHLYHVANHLSWIQDLEYSEFGCVLDHSTIITRWEYADDARDQVCYLCRERPLMNKLLSVRKKWGIDFSLDYVYSGGATEIIHIEADYVDFSEVLADKARAEELILNTDWAHGAKAVIAHKSEWESLNSDDQADWKARFFGWRRAFDNKKVFI
jgi:hypothetical protein